VKVGASSVPGQQCRPYALPHRSGTQDQTTVD
jgi:hypothetical protein